MDWLILLAIVTMAFLAHILPEKATFNIFWPCLFLALLVGYGFTFWLSVRRGPLRPH